MNGREKHFQQRSKLLAFLKLFMVNECGKCRGLLEESLGRATLLIIKSKMNCVSLPCDSPYFMPWNDAVYRVKWRCLQHKMIYTTLRMTWVYVVVLIFPLHNLLIVSFWKQFHLLQLHMIINPNPSQFISQNLREHPSKHIEITQYLFHFNDRSPTK